MRDVMMNIGCPRCGRAVRKQDWHDLPPKLEEYSCLGCGERFWNELELREREHHRPSWLPPDPKIRLSGN